MGGHGFLRDEAIDKWGAMRENTWRHFKFTPKTTRQAVLWGLVVPLIVYEAAIANYRLNDKKDGRAVRDYPSIFNLGQ